MSCSWGGTLGGGWGCGFSTEPARHWTVVTHVRWIFITLPITRPNCTQSVVIKTVYTWGSTWGGTLGGNRGGT